MIMKEIEAALGFVYSLIGNRRAINSYSLCDMLGISIIGNNPLDKDGYLICSDGLKLIFVNSAITNIHRKRFVIAHEIGHFLMHTDQMYCCSDIRMNQPSKINSTSQEMQANEFASELLLPTDDLINHLPQGHLSFASIFDIASLYDVSVTMAAIKAVKNSKTENEILLCYENNRFKWYATGNNDVFYSQIPSMCPIELDNRTGCSTVYGYWDCLFNGAVSQEIFRPYGKQYLVLLAGSEWNTYREWY